MSVIDLEAVRAERGLFTAGDRYYTHAVLDTIYDKGASIDDRLAAMRIWYGWILDRVDYPEETAATMEPIIARRKARKATPQG